MTLPAIEPILVVEDKPHVLSMLTAVLAAAGLKAPDVATSGTEAIRCLQVRRYALVVCERFMQPISGIDLKTLMNARQDWARIPFVCVISSDKPGDAAKREAAGILHCLGCPPAQDELLRVLGAAHGQHRAA